MKAQEFDHIVDDRIQGTHARRSDIADFVHWCCGKLGIATSKLPTIELCRDRERAQQRHRTGEFDLEDHHLVVYVGNRNLVDILRTVAHELTHVHQKMHNAIRDSGPGSDTESTADQVAGYLIKVYGKLHPDIFE